MNEDISKPENRVNLALFSLMQQDWFREWILKRLRLPADAVVYPPTNVHGRRPDLKVARDGSELAMIEVELGTNLGQAEDYRKQFATVKTIWGKRESGSDLSLEEVAEFLEGPRSLSPQTRFNVEHLRKLIIEGLSEHSSSGGGATCPRRCGSTGWWSPSATGSAIGSRQRPIGSRSVTSKQTPLERKAFR